MDGVPLRSTEKEGFLQYTKAINPIYKPPKRGKMTSMLEKFHQKKVPEIKALIQKIDWYSMTFDGWTEPQTTTSYLGVTFHFLDGTALKTFRLGVLELTESHTSTYLKTCLLDFMAKWGLQNDKIPAVSTDSAPNVKKTVADTFGAHKWVPCTAHIINLIAKNALGKHVVDKRKIDYVPGIPALKKKVKAIVSYAHHSTNFANEVRRLQMTNNVARGNCLRPIQEVETRWGSSLASIERFIELKDIIVGASLNVPGCPSLPSNEELISLGIIVKILEPFKDATEELSAEKIPTISKVLPLVRMLHDVSIMLFFFRYLSIFFYQIQ